MRLRSPAARLMAPALSPGASHLVIFHFVVDGSAQVRLPNGQLKMISTMATGETKTTSLTEGTSTPAHRVGWRRVKGE